MGDPYMTSQASRGLNNLVTEAFQKYDTGRRKGSENYVTSFLDDRFIEVLNTFILLDWVITVKGRKRVSFFDINNN